MHNTYARREILRLLQDNPSITQREISALLNIHTDTVCNNIRAFVENGIIEKTPIYSRGFIKKYKYEVKNEKK